MAVGDILNEVPVFNSPITPGGGDTARDLELFQEAISRYLKRLRDALVEELEAIEAELNP